MRASAFSDNQEAFLLKQGDDGAPVAEICRKAGVSQATYFAWRKKFAGLLPTEMRRLKQIEDENARLRKRVADLSLDKEMLRGTSSAESSFANVSRTIGVPLAHPARKRELVDGICREWGVSIRRACDALEMERSTCPYRSRRPGQAPLETRIKEICETRVRYGARRVHVLMRREGWMINHRNAARLQ